MGEQLSIEGTERARVEPKKPRRRVRRLARNHVPDPGWINVSKAELASLDESASVPSLCSTGWKNRRANRTQPVTCRICLGMLFDQVQYRNLLVSKGWKIR